MDRYEIKPHSRYVSIWKNGVRIAKVPIAWRSDDKYGLPRAEAKAMAASIVDALEQVQNHPAFLSRLDMHGIDSLIH